MQFIYDIAMSHPNVQKQLQNGDVISTNCAQGYSSAHVAESSLRAQTVLCGVVAPSYQHYHHGGVDNKVPELYATRSELLD